VRRIVHAPDGARWEIASRWYRRPRLRRFRGNGLDLLDVPWFAVDDAGGFVAGLLVSILVVAVLAVLVVVLLPVILFVLEIPLVLALVFVVRRLWIVEAVSSGGTRRAWRVRGWLRSRRAVREVARELETGEEIEVGTEVVVIERVGPRTVKVIPFEEAQT
jgi:hypothetical protein